MTVGAVLAPAMLLALPFENPAISARFSVAMTCIVWIVAICGGAWFRTAPGHRLFLSWRIAVAGLLLLGFYTLAIELTVYRFGPSGLAALLAATILPILGLFVYAIRKRIYRNENPKPGLMGAASAIGATVGAGVLRYLGAPAMTLVPIVLYALLTIVVGYLFLDYCRLLYADIVQRRQSEN